MIERSTARATRTVHLISHSSAHAPDALSSVPLSLFPTPFHASPFSCDSSDNHLLAGSLHICSQRCSAPPSSIAPNIAARLHK